MFCQDPEGWYAYFLSAFQGGSGFIIIVAMQGYAVKRVPKMIRGIVMALIIALSGFGGIIYLQLSKIFFKTAPNMVFGLIGLFDCLVLVFIVVMIAMGKYGDAPPQEDTFGEGNSQKQEGGTADFIKDHDFDDDIPDVPFSKDLYDEHIPELSSYREEDSLTTKGFGGLGKSVTSKVYDDYELQSSRKNLDSMMGALKQTGGFEGSRKSYETPLLNSNNGGKTDQRITITKARNTKLLNMESGVSND